MKWRPFGSSGVRSGNLTTATKSKKPKRYTYGPEVIEWIEDNCPLPSGEHIGEPFKLMDWQKEWIRELQRTDKNGTLQYRWALLGVPKSSGKSPLVAALALYHLLGDPDEPDPYVVVAASSDKQADIVFDACKRMCEMSPTLADLTERYRWEIQAKGAPGKLERVAASRGKLDGKSISFLVIDELHEWIEENWVILTGGAMKRRRAQIVQITTAGWDRESICYREYLKKDTPPGENPSYFVRWYGAPDDADHTDPEVWEQANPSWGELVHEDMLRDLLRNQPESQFRRYRLNQWVESEEFWLPPGAWEECQVEAHEMSQDAPTYIGWDASTHNDSTAIVAVQWQGDKLHTFSRVWSRPFLPNGNPDHSWALPIVECEEYIRDLCREYNVRSVAYDPAFITWSAQDLEAEGLPMENWPQSPARMCPATQSLYEAIVNQRLAHDGDVELRAHIRNSVAYYERRGGWRLNKGPKHKKIDAAIALVMAVGVLVAAEEPEKPGIAFWFPPDDNDESANAGDQ